MGLWTKRTEWPVNSGSVAQSLPASVPAASPKPLMLAMLRRVFSGMQRSSISVRRP